MVDGVTVGAIAEGLVLIGLGVACWRQSMQIADLKRGAFAKLAAHVTTPEERTVTEQVARNAEPPSKGAKPIPSRPIYGPEPVRLPRASVRDPLPPADVSRETPVTQIKVPASTEQPHNRLTKVGRLKMQANHPKYSAKTHERARAELAAMGLTSQGNPKRKTK